jgi:hypothetical protein
LAWNVSLILEHTYYGEKEQVDLFKSMFNRVIPCVLSLTTVLMILQVLDYLKLVYLVQVHRFWEPAEFSVNVSLALPLAILSLIIVLWIMATRPKFALIPALGLGSLLFVSSIVSIVLVSLLCIIASLLLSGKIRDYLLGLVGLLCILEAGALLQWLIFEPLGVVNPLIGLADFESNLYYLVAQLSPLIMLGFSILGVIIPILHFSKGALEIEAQKSEMPGGKYYELFFLSLVLVLSVTVAMYPYLPRVNPLGVNTGVDSPQYLLEFKQVEADPIQAFHVSGGSRPVLYILLFGFQKLTSLNAQDTIKWIPIVLNPLLVLSTFFLALEMMGNYRAALYAGFFTAVGYSLSGGMYAYFLADVLTLSIILASLGFLLRLYRRGNRLDLVIASILGSLFVFTHPWTLDQYVAPVAVIGVLVTYLYLRRGGDSLSPWGLISYCGVIASADVVKVLLLSGSVDGVAALSTLSQGITSTQMFWFDLVNSSRFILGGFLTSLPLLVLAVIGMWRIKERNLPNSLILLFVAMTSVVYLVGDVVVKSRLIYNLPIGILAAYGLVYLDDIIVDHRVKSLITGTLVIMLLTYLFRGLATLV